MLAQGQFWRAALGKGEECVLLALQRDALPEELEEIKDLRIELPLERWNSLLKHILSDRRLFGGVLLDSAKNEEHLSAAIGSDRLFRDLQNLVLEATACLVEEGAIQVVPADALED